MKDAPAEVRPLLARARRDEDDAALAYLVGRMVEAQRQMAAAVAAELGVQAGDYGMEEEEFCELLRPICEDENATENEVSQVGTSEGEGKTEFIEDKNGTEDVITAATTSTHLEEESTSVFIKKMPNQTAVTVNLLPILA